MNARRLLGVLLVWAILLPAAAAESTHTDPAGDVVVQTDTTAPVAGAAGADVPYVDILGVNVTGTNVTLGLGCLNMFVNATSYELINRDAIYLIRGSNATHAIEVGVWARWTSYYAWVDARNASSGLLESRVVPAVWGYTHTTNFTVVVGQAIEVEQVVAYTNSSTNATGAWAVDFYGFPAPGAPPSWIARYWWVLLLAGLVAGVGFALYYGLRKPEPAGREIVPLSGV